MWPFKPKMRESVAATQFVLHTADAITRLWPEIKGNLRPALRGDGKTLDGPDAPVAFFLGGIALHLQTVTNLMPPEQAARVRRYILLSTEKTAEDIDTLAALDEHQQAWDEAMKVKDNPVVAVAGVLFDHLGCESNVKIGNGAAKDPLVLMALAGAVMEIGGVPYWKTVTRNYKLIPG